MRDFTIETKDLSGLTTKEKDLIITAAMKRERFVDVAGASGVAYCDCAEPLKNVRLSFYMSPNLTGLRADYMAGICECGKVFASFIAPLGS